MSFFSRLASFGGRLVGGIVRGQDPISAAISASHPGQYASVTGTTQGGYQPVGGQIFQEGFPALPGVGALSRLPSIARGAGRVVGGAARGVGALARQYPRTAAMSRAVAEALGYTIVGGWILDQAGNVFGRVKKRRINPLNHRALMRACRRIKSSKKILKKVERVCGTSSPRRSAPARRGRKC